MKEIILQTEIPCLVMTNEEESFLSPTDILKLSEKEIYIYPISNRKILPFKIDLNKPNSKYYRMIEDANTIRCFIFAPVVLQKKVVERKKIDEKEIVITICSNEIKVETESEELLLPIDFTPLEYKTKVIEHFLIVEIKSHNKAKLFIFNPHTLYFKMYNIKNLNIEKKAISFEQVFNDFASTTLSKSIEFDKDNITEKSSSPNFSNYRVTKETVCYAFLDCVLNENYTLAKKLLTENYASIEEEQLKLYFGKYVKFFHIKENMFLLIYNKSNKVVSFNLNYDKIADFQIEDV